MTICLTLFVSLFYGCKSGGEKHIDNSTEVKHILDSASYLLDIGEEQTAFSYLEQSYTRLNPTEPIEIWSKYNFKVRYYLNYNINSAKARLYADSLLNTITPVSKKYPYQYAVSLFTKGDVLRAGGDFESAFNYYYQAKIFASKNLDNCSRSDLSGRMGLVRYRQENYPRAISFFKQALAERLLCRDTTFDALVYSPQGTLNALALSYEKNNMPDSAIYYYREALKLLNNHEHKFPDQKRFFSIAKGVIYGNLGGVYAKQSHYDEAEQMLKSSIEMNNRRGYAIDDAQTAKIKLINFYLANGRYANASEVLNEVGNYLDSIKPIRNRNNQILQDWLKAKSKYFVKTGESLKAYQVLLKADSLRDSLLKISLSLKRTDFDRGIDNAERRYEMLNLEKNSERKTLLLYGSVILLLLVLLIVFLLLRSLKKDRKNLAALRLLNGQIINSYEALEETSNENENLLQVIAHDLRNPISGMMMASSTLAYLTPPNEKNKSIYELIQHSGREALSLINELLESKQNAVLKLQETELYEVIYYCVKMLEHKADEKGIVIKVKSDRISMKLNREKVWQMLSNLIGNAIKFSESKSIINVSAIREDGFALISIVDEGIGIPAEMVEHLFKNNQTVRRTGTKGEPSFGLGLSIVKQIVDAHHGRVAYMPNPDGGSIFKIWLPLNN